MDVLFKLVEERFGFTMTNPLKGVVPHVVMMSIRNEMVEAVNLNGEATYELRKDYDEWVVKKFLSKMLSYSNNIVNNLKGTYNTVVLTDTQWWELTAIALKEYRGNSYFNTTYTEDVDRLLHERHLDKELIAKRLAEALGYPDLKIQIDSVGGCVRFIGTNLDSEVIKRFEDKSEYHFDFSSIDRRVTISRNYHEINGDVYCHYDGVMKDDNKYSGLLAELHRTIDRIKGY